MPQDSNILTPLADGGAAMPVTRWSLVMSAGNGSSSALEQLCRAYWYPLYVYLRRWGRNPDDAKELIQSFLFHIFCDPAKNRLEGLDPERGKFRSWLLVCLKRYAKDHKLNELGSPSNPLPLEVEDAEDRYLHEPIDPNATPDVAYEQSWAGEILHRATQRLRTQFAAEDKSGRFEVLLKFLPGKHPDMSREEAARQLGSSESAINTEVTRMRQQLANLVRKEVSELLNDPATDLEQELRYMMGLFGRR